MDQFLNHVETTYFYLSIDNNNAKKECLKAIKLLNSLPKSTKFLKPLSEFTLNLYQLTKSPSMSTNDKLKWISCKLNGQFYPPVIDFGEISSHNELFLGHFHDDDVLDLPKYPIDYKSVIVDDWSDELDLYQDLLPNCSFVSAFLGLLDKFNTSSIITPHKPSDSYIVKLHFNGEARNVKIDNKLPLLNERNLIIKSLNSNTYWPALVEKAYLKIMGQGYNFKGSNMANDAYMLSGYIPEIITIENGKLNLSYLKSLNNAVLGIGTAKLSETLSHQLNLISEHDYVIESINDTSITIKNPWITTNRLITIDDFTYFKYVYINWNKELNFVHHFIYNNQQFKVNGWVLIEKHLPFDKNWMSVSVYNSDYKVLSPTEYKQINYIETNNRLQLIKLEKCSTIVINSTHGGTFTISSNYNIEKSSHQYKFIKELSGEWDSQTNGGNWSMSTYIDNPQYKLSIDKLTNIKIALYSKGLVNFHLFHGSKIEKFHKPINNENYNHDPLGKFTLVPGTYTLVPSRYDKSIEKFKLLINSDFPINITLHSPYLGLFNKSITFQWNNTNRYKYEFHISEITSVTFKINYYKNEQQQYEIQSNYRPGLRASLFRNKQPVQINKNFDDSLYGFFLHEEALQPGAYILLIERFEIGFGYCKIFIGSNKKI